MSSTNNGERIDDLIGDSIDDLSTEEAIALTQLLEMGFSVNQSRTVLTNSRGNLQTAIVSILDNSNISDNYTTDATDGLSQLGEGYQAKREGILQKIFKKMSILEENNHSKQLLLNKTNSDDNASDFQLSPPMNPAYRPEKSDSIAAVPPTLTTDKRSPQSGQQEHYKDNSDDYINSLAIALSLSTQKGESSLAIDNEIPIDTAHPTSAANSSPPSQPAEQLNEDYMNSLAIALSLSTQEVESTEGTIASPPLHSTSSSINISPSTYNYKNSWDGLHSALNDPCVDLTAASTGSMDAVDVGDVGKGSELIKVVDVELKGAAMSYSTLMDILSSDVESTSMDRDTSIQSALVNHIQEPQSQSQLPHLQQASAPEFEKSDDNASSLGICKMESNAIDDKSNSNLKSASSCITSYVDDSHATGPGVAIAGLTAMTSFDIGLFGEIGTNGKDEKDVAIVQDSQRTSIYPISPAVSEFAYGSVDFRHDHHESTPSTEELIGKMPACDVHSSGDDVAVQGRSDLSQFDPYADFPSNYTNDMRRFLSHEGDFPPMTTSGTVEPSAPMLLEEEEDDFNVIDELDLFENDIPDAAPTFTSHAATLAPTNDSSMYNRNSISRELQNMLGKINRRQHLPYTVRQVSVGKWVGNISLKQTALPSSVSTPQGNRADSVVATGNCTTREICEQWCMSVAPPKWFNKTSFARCLLCPTQFGIFTHRHHCRNCGYVFCNACSQTSWPSSMLPPFYHNSEKNVRICDDCNMLMLVFVDALKSGDQATALAVFNTGNVNLHRSFSLFASGAYAVHFAAVGGNLSLLKWLIESEHCPIFSKSGADKSPLTTSSGMTVFAIAAKKGFIDVMRYLAREKGCAVTEISDVDILQRGLHVALELSGPLPPLQPTKKKQKAKDEETLLTIAGKIVAPPVKYQLQLNRQQQQQQYPMNNAPAPLPSHSINHSNRSTISGPSSSSQSSLAGVTTARTDVSPRASSAFPVRESFADSTAGSRSARSSGASMVSTPSASRGPPQSAVPSRESFAYPMPVDRSTRTSAASTYSVATPSKPPQGQSQSAVPSRESFAPPASQDRSTRHSGASAVNRSSFEDMGSVVTATAIPVAPTNPIVIPPNGGRIQVVANSIYVPPSVMSSPNYRNWSNTHVPIMEVVEQSNTGNNQQQNGSWLGRGRR